MGSNGCRDSALVVMLALKPQVHLPQVPNGFQWVPNQCIFRSACWPQGPRRTHQVSSQHGRQRETDVGYIGHVGHVWDGHVGNVSRWTRFSTSGQLWILMRFGHFWTRFGHVWTRTIFWTRGHLAQAKRSGSYRDQKQPKINKNTAYTQEHSFHKNAAKMC